MSTITSACSATNTPEWLKRCHQLGLKANVWTVNEQKDLQWCIDQGFDFITTNEPVLLEQMLKK